MVAILIELITIFLAVSFLVYQVIIPAATGKMLFPMFRTKLRKLENEKSELLVEKQVRDAVEEVSTMKEKLNPKVDQ